MANRLVLTSSKRLVGKVVRHYKGGEYRVLAVAQHTEEPLSAFVIYAPTQQTGTAATWARPVDMFMGTIIHRGEVVPRFSFATVPHDGFV